MGSVEKVCCQKVNNVDQNSGVGPDPTFWADLYLRAPPGISERVRVVTNVGSPVIHSGQFDISTVGPRGAIISWNDGIFSEWRSPYFGTYTADGF